MWSCSACTFAILFLAASNVELVAPRRAAAETLPAVLAKAYQNNPQLNAQRAYVRQTEEQVNVATAGYLPKVEASASTGPRHTDSRFRETSIHKREQLTTSTVGVTASQTLFDGFRTPNQVSAAEGKVRAAREVLRLMTQQILLDAATVYMNTIRDTATAQLQRHNVEMLQEQLKQVRQRLVLREVTTTDVSQAETRLAAARWQRLAAESALTTSRAGYRRVIGEEPEEKLMPTAAVDGLLPQNQKEAVDIALAENPQIIAAQLGVDVAAIQVKIAEGALYPTARLDAGAQYGWDVTSQLNRQLSAGAFVTLSVPIYQGGAEYASIREFEGGCRPEALRSRPGSRSRPCRRRRVVGTVRRGEGPDRSRECRSDGGRIGAQRGDAGSTRRPADHAGSAQRPTGGGQRQDDGRHDAARSCRDLVWRARLSRAPLTRGASIVERSCCRAKAVSALEGRYCARDVPGMGKSCSWGGRRHRRRPADARRRSDTDDDRGRARSTRLAGN